MIFDDWEALGYESEEEYQKAYDDYVTQLEIDRKAEEHDALTEITRELCRNRIESYMEELNERNELQEDS